MRQWQHSPCSPASSPWQLVETGQRSWMKEGLLRFIFKLRPRMSGAWTVPLESGDMTQLSHWRSGSHSMSGGGQCAFRWVLKTLTLWQLPADNYKTRLPLRSPENSTDVFSLSSSWNHRPSHQPNWFQTTWESFKLNNQPIIARPTFCIRQPGMDDNWEVNPTSLSFHVIQN